MYEIIFNIINLIIFLYLFDIILLIVVNKIKFYKNTENEQEKDKKITNLAKIKMRYFLRRAFSIINPATKIKWNWHLNYLCDILEAVADGKIKRLMINIPPRYLKSIICSVTFPAWLFGKDPTKRIIVASYSKILALKHSQDTRIIMQSKWYKKNFPNTILASGMNEKNKFCTTENGFRFATSVNGTLTGEGGDILIVDDPHNPVGIYNKSNRKRTINWFTGVFSSRLNDKNTGSIIVIMQRLHLEDLSGYILSKNTNNDWTVITLPAIADEQEEYYLLDKLYKVRKIGDVLNPSMESKNTLEKIKHDLGEYNFEAQYQQNPVALDGNMIKKSWLKYFNLSELNNLFFTKKQFYHISIDCASGLGTENDFTAIAVFVIVDNKFYLCDMYRLKIPYPELRAKIEEIITKYQASSVLIEDKSNGSSMIQDLQTKYTNIIPIKPIKSKECRVNDILTTLEAGKILIANNEQWTQELEVELLSFPACKHDDQVDAISQFINWYNMNRKNCTQVPKIRKM